ncbi:MAG: carbohydrate ABC transporter permease [Treponema sp.]|jgi:putative aldouronate transport system permease protein|nr:carbohydrate ABC transporter permease [Treponema sp.]
MKTSAGERVFDVFNIILTALVAFVCVYPMWYVCMSSFSDADLYANTYSAMWKPLGFSLRAYEVVLNNPNIKSGYYNTLIYAFAGTAANIFMTVLGAYGLSRKNIMVKRAFMVFIVVSMYFSGGMIPNFLLVKALGMYNTRFALIVPGLIATWNLIILRTAFSQIPYELEESVKIDGGNDLVILWCITVPMAKATIAVIAMYYMVGHWNAWFGAMIYLQDAKLKPLQLFLRDILISLTVSGNTVDGGVEIANLYLTVRHATIMVSTLPILVIYPFIQKYFTRGLMMGSLKG